MKKRPIQYFYSSNPSSEAEFWENAMIRLSENSLFIYKRYDFMIQQDLSFEYKHFLALKGIGHLPQQSILINY